MKEGWRMVKLGEVSSFQNGFAFKSSLFKNEGEPIIRISNIQDEKLSTNDLVYFNPKDYKVNFDQYRIFPNDILIAMSGGTTGKLGINQDNRVYYQNQRVGVIREKADVLCRQYLYYFLQTKTEESLKIAAGAAQPNLSTAQINNFDLPLPLLEEQHRIVSILDASFEKIDALKKNAEENLKNAKALFKQVLAQELKPKEGWVEKKLGEVSSFQNGFAFKSSLFKDEGDPIIRISNIQDEKLTTNGLVYFNPKDYNVNFDQYRIFPNDILIAMSGGTTGKLGINQDNRIYYQNQRVGVIREKADVLCRQYLYYFLQTKTEESLKIAAGAAQPNLSTAQINNFDLPLPPLDEQHRIVRTLDTLSEKCRRLEQLSQRAIRECDALKQSILRQAFSGEL